VVGPVARCSGRIRLPAHVADPGLATLIAGSGSSSLERFATAVNHRGSEMHGVKTSYNHVTVKRWLAGSVCQYPERRGPWSDVMFPVLACGCRVSRR